MSEEENKGVAVEETAQATAQASEAENVQEERQVSAEEVKKRNDVEYNWAEARRKMQELERQNREMAEQFAKMQKAQVPQEDDELDKLSDDDIVTKAQAKKLMAKMAREMAQEAIKSHAASTVEERIKLKYSDYDEIVTKENIEKLKALKPSLAISLAHTPDPYAQAEAVYDALKMIGTVADSKPSSNYEKEKALKNSQKPLSVNAVSKSSAIGNVHLFENGLTPELKKQLWQEMKQAAKSA